MNKKFLANVLAASLVLTMAPIVPNADADAAQKLNVSSQQGGGISNLSGLKTAYVATSPAIGEGTEFNDDITCAGLLSAHTKGIEVTAEGVTLTFHNVSTGSANWDSPAYVVYTGDEAAVEGSGYYEYGYVRSDLWAWGTNKTLWAANVEDWAANANGKNDGNPYVIANAPDTGDEWATWQNANKSKDGANYMVSAVIKKSAMVLYVNANGIEFATAFKVDTSKPVYLSLAGENCTLSDIKKANQYYDFTSKIPEKVNTFIEESDKVVPPVEDENAEHLYSSNAWWTFTGNTPDQTISGDGSIEWYVGYYENIKGVTGAFSVELQTDRYFITTGSDVNAWYAESAQGDAITGVALNSKYIDLGHIYKITVARSGQDFKITYFDVTANSKYAEFEAKNTNFPEGDVNVHVMAQVGKYRIETESFDTMPEVVDNNPPLASYPLYTPTPTAAPTLPPASEEDDNTPGLELECGAFWSAHTGGTEVTSDGIAIKFRNVSSGSENWNTPIVVGYSANEPLVNGAGYKEYVVIRSDAYAWNPSNNSADTAAWEASGYKMVATPPSDWASWLSANKSGVDCLVQAIKVDGKVYIQIENNGVTTITSFAVPDGEKFYISLSGELCKLTNIKNTKYTGIDGVGSGVEPSATPDALASPEPSATPDASASPEPGDNNNNTPGDNNTTGGDTTNTPNDTEEPKDEDKDTKKTMKVSGIKAKKNTKKVTGTVSVKGAKVKVKIGNKAYKNAKVSGKKFTFTASSKLKKGTKVTIKVTKSGYKTVTKTVKVK